MATIFKRPGQELYEAKRALLSTLKARPCCITDDDRRSLRRLFAAVLNVENAPDGDQEAVALADALADYDARVAGSTGERATALQESQPMSREAKASFSAQLTRAQKGR